MAPDAGPADLLARWMATMGPMLAAMQLGSAVGHLARSTLGPYELPIPRAAPRLLVVPANVTRFAEDWSLDPDEVRLWVCLREVTAHAVLSRPHVAAAHAGAPGAGGAGDGRGHRRPRGHLQGIDLTQPEALQGLLGDPTALMSLEPSPARRRAAEDLLAVVAALLGYVEHVLDLAAARLLGGRGAIAEAWRRRQVDRESSDRAAELMLGLDLGPGADRPGRGLRPRRVRAGRRRRPGPAVVGPPYPAHPGRGRRPGAVAGADRPARARPERPDNARSDAPSAPAVVAASGGGRRLFLGDAEVPLELEVLALGVADDALAVAPELGVVGGQQGEPGERAVPEGVDDRRLAVGRLHLPVRRHRAQVDHPDVATRRLGLFLLLDSSATAPPRVGAQTNW